MADKEIDVYGIDEANKESQKEYEKLQDRKEDDVRKVLKTPEGRRLLLEIITESGVVHASFSQNSMVTAFNEGKRDIGLFLLKKIDKVEPMAFSQMLREYFSESRSKKNQREEKDV